MAEMARSEITINLGALRRNVTHLSAVAEGSELWAVVKANAYGHGAADQAYVGLGGQVFMASTEAEAKRVFRPYFDNAPVYGHGPSLEDFTEMTPLTVGTPEQVIERTLGFAD